MVNYMLMICADLENLIDLQPQGGCDDPNFSYFFKVLHFLFFIFSVFTIIPWFLISSWFCFSSCYLFCILLSFEYREVFYQFFFCIYDFPFCRLYACLQFHCVLHYNCEICLRASGSRLLKLPGSNLVFTIFLKFRWLLWHKCSYCSPVFYCFESLVLLFVLFAIRIGFFFF